MDIFHEEIGFMDELDEIYSYSHARHKKSDNCAWCEMVRLVAIRRDFLWRLQECRLPVNHLNMWSLGSTLSDTVMNRKVILRDWGHFRARMAKEGTWVPIFRVLEKGRRGFLHIHFICLSYLKHDIVLKAWRSIRQESANVHVSGQKGKQDPGRLASYLMKYLTKEGTSYRWMGPFYGLKRVREPVLSKDGSEKILTFGGFTSYGFFSKVIEKRPAHAQSKIDDLGSHSQEVI